MLRCLKKKKKEEKNILIISINVKERLRFQKLSKRKALVKTSSLDVVLAPDSFHDLVNFFDLGLKFINL